MPSDCDRLCRKQITRAFTLTPILIRLRALFDEGAAFHLTERPLSADQSLRKTGGGYYRLTATVPANEELRW